MDHYGLTRAALALGVLAASAGAVSAQEAVQTNAPMTNEQMIAAQQRQIEAQQRQIDALRDQLEDVSALLSNRVERVEAATENGRVTMANPNARHSMNIVGAVQATFGVADQDREGSAAPELNGGSEIKRARIGLQGTAFNDYAYAVEVELAQLPGASPSVAAAARDLWVAYNGFRPWSFTVGNMKPQVGLEASFSDRSNAATFAESSMMTSLITTPGARFVGLRAARGGQHWSTALGIYGDDVNNNGVTATPFAEGMGMHGRFTWAPIATPTSLLHFGVSGYERDVATVTVAASATTPAAQGQLRPRAQPENTLDSARLIDAGNLNFAESVNLLGLEAAAVYGPFGVQAEYATMNVSQALNRPDLEFSGGYVNVNWFLTGESRVYDPRSGVFTRMTPRAVMDPRAGAWGAWELAARYSTLDLNSDENLFAGATFVGARGGEETNYTLGLNWYWTPYFRMMLNWVHAEADKQGAPASALNLAGANQDTEADLISVRVQQEW